MDEDEGAMVKRKLEVLTKEVSALHSFTLNTVMQKEGSEKDLLSLTG